LGCIKGYWLEKPKKPQRVIEGQLFVSNARLVFVPLEATVEHSQLAPLVSIPHRAIAGTEVLNAKKRIDSTLLTSLEASAVSTGLISSINTGLSSSGTFAPVVSSSSPSKSISNSGATSSGNKRNSLSGGVRIGSHGYSSGNANTSSESLNNSSSANSSGSDWISYESNFLIMTLSCHDVRRESFVFPISSGTSLNSLVNLINEQCVILRFSPQSFQIAYAQAAANNTAAAARKSVSLPDDEQLLSECEREHDERTSDYDEWVVYTQTQQATLGEAAAIGSQQLPPKWCALYPPKFVMPKKVDEEMLTKASKLYQEQMHPLLMWRHERSGAYTHSYI